MIVLKITSNDKTSHLLKLIGDVQDVPGDAAECGVYQGGNLLYLARAMRPRHIYGFDTFQGLPLESWREGEPHNVGDFADAKWGETFFNFSNERNVTLVRGIFPQSAQSLMHHKFAFVYVDFDYYISTRDAIMFFAPRMNEGGVMAFDDYEWPQCPGVTEALEQSGLEVEIPVKHLAVVHFAHAFA